jgi:hypothetical protein
MLKVLLIVRKSLCFLSEHFFKAIIKKTTLFPFNYSGFMVFNATFNNISVISWWSVLLYLFGKISNGNISKRDVMMF